MQHYLKAGEGRAVIMDSDSPTPLAACLVQAFDELSSGADARDSAGRHAASAAVGKLADGPRRERIIQPEAN